MGILRENISDFFLFMYYKWSIQKSKSGSTYKYYTVLQSYLNEG
jgi:hypothetical protein